MSRRRRRGSSAEIFFRFICDDGERTVSRPKRVAVRSFAVVQLQFRKRAGCVRELPGRVVEYHRAGRHLHPVGAFETDRFADTVVGPLVSACAADVLRMRCGRQEQKTETGQQCREFGGFRMRKHTCREESRSGAVPACSRCRRGEALCYPIAERVPCRRITASTPGNL